MELRGLVGKFSEKHDKQLLKSFHMAVIVKPTTPRLKIFHVPEQVTPRDHYSNQMTIKH